MAAAKAEAVEELTRLYRELPPRPAVEEVEAAAAVLASADAEQEARLAEIAREEALARARALEDGVPAELVAVLAEARRNAVRLRALQQRKEAAHVVELEKQFKVFDDLIQRASRVVSSGEGGGEGRDGVAAHEVVEVEDKRKEAAVVAAAAAMEIDRGSKSGLSLESRPVSTLRRAGSAGILLSRFVLFSHQSLAQLLRSAI